jgi:hypothetical protein
LLFNSFFVQVERHLKRWKVALFSFSSHGRRALVGAVVTTMATLSVSIPAAASPPAGGDAGLGGTGTDASSTSDKTSGLRTVESDSPAEIAGDVAMQAAAAKARSTGRAVVVDALTSETEQVTARPGGGFTYVGDPTPVRTKLKGEWRPVDTTLHRDAGGTYSPAATAYGTVTFSGGGTAPLATTRSGATSYAVTWPGRLPAPSVAGSTATYANVLPGVDLVVSATADGGFHEVLAVANAQAAADQGLATIALGATVRNGRPSADGVITTAPDTGMELSSATAVMWDSSRPSTAAVRPDRSDATHPGLAAHEALVGVRSGPGRLSLVPDATLLHDPATVFPVYIDPTTSWHPASGGKPAFDEVKQGSPCNGASYYNNTGSAGNDGNLGVGYNGWPGGCVGDEHAFYQWTIPAAVKTSDVTIDSATVKATETYASSCDATATVNLHWTGAIGSGTDWNNRPANNSGFSTSESFVSAANPDSCPTRDDVSEGFDVKAAFLKARTGSKFTVVLSQDSNESAKNRNAFKRFSDDPELTVDFNRAPATPSAAQLSAVSGTNNVGCDTAAPYPYMGKSMATNTPVLSAKISDPDADKLRVTFKYWVEGSITAAATVLSGDNLASGSTAKVSLPAAFVSGLADGSTVDWAVSVTDGIATTAYPSWSCHFEAEPHAVLDPSIDPNSTYPDTDNDGGIGAPAGTAATFALHNTGTAATKFLYNLDVPPALTNTPAAETVTAVSNAASVTVTPAAPGPHTLWVAAVDAAGDASATEGYDFEADGHGNVTCASLSLCFNNTAVSADSTPAQADADGSGSSFSATDLTNAGWATNGKIDVDGALFQLPAYGGGVPDNVLAANQTITYGYSVPAVGKGVTSLSFLAFSTDAKEATAAAVDGNATTPFLPGGTAVAGRYCFDSVHPEALCTPYGKITYVGGETDSFALDVPDWSAGPSTVAALALTKRNSSVGAGAHPAKIYQFSVPLAAGLTVQSITLPDVSDKVGAGVEGLHILSMAPRNTTVSTTEANGTPATPVAGRTWTGAWASPTELASNYLTPAGTNFSNQTFRVAVKPSITGDTVRIRLDDALGTAPLSIGHATVALDSGAPPNASPSGAFHNLTFGGTAATKIPTGGMVYSDPLTFAVTANQWLLVSFSLTNSVALLPEHSWASDTDATFVSPPGSGDLTTSTDTTKFNPDDTAGAHAGNFTNVLTNIDVTTAGTTTQAILGDGLVDAFQDNTKPNGQTGVRLSDDLIAAEPTTPGAYGTLAAGVESNYLLADNPQYYSGRMIGGPSALSRIDRDILSQPGISTVVLDEGLEDLLNGQSAEALEDDGFAQLLTALEFNGVNVVVMGLHPCDGYGGSGAVTSTGASANDPCTATVDANREDVNNWLSEGGFSDLGTWTTPSMYFIDTDAAMGVPDTTNGELKLDPNAAIATDHVNLADSGYAAMTTAYLGPQNSWQLDDSGVPDPTVTSAEDGADNATNPYLAGNPLVGTNPATLVGGATWATDTTRGAVLSLNGADAGADTAGPVLTTAGSYSVSAWAKLTSTAATVTVAAEMGANNAAFTLGYNKSFNAWTFQAAGSDSATPAASPHVSATTAPSLNAWTHLVGTYNASTHVMTLYVNGASVGTPVTDTTAWNATGTFDIGHAGATGYLPGLLSDVQAWNYTLTPQQVKALDQQIN